MDLQTTEARRDPAVSYEIREASNARGWRVLVDGRDLGWSFITPVAARDAARHHGLGDWDEAWGKA